MIIMNNIIQKKRHVKIYHFLLKIISVCYTPTMFKTTNTKNAYGIVKKKRKKKGNSVIMDKDQIYLTK